MGQCNVEHYALQKDPPTLSYPTNNPYEVSSQLELPYIKTLLQHKTTYLI